MDEKEQELKAHGWCIRIDGEFISSSFKPDPLQAELEGLKAVGIERMKATGELVLVRLVEVERAEQGDKRG